VLLSLNFCLLSCLTPTSILELPYLLNGRSEFHNNFGIALNRVNITSSIIFVTGQDESSVQQLIDACIQDDDKLYLCVSSPTIKDKPVQIRPWRLSDADFVLDASMPLDPRKTVFVGGVPRPLKAGKSRPECATRLTDTILKGIRTA